MVTYAERDDSVDAAVAREMLALIDEAGPCKPWTLVAEVAAEGEREAVRAQVLKPLILRGVLTPNADGNIRIMDRDRLDEITD